MDSKKIKKLLILNIPYFIVGLIATNFGEAWRVAEGADSSAKILSLFLPFQRRLGILCPAYTRLICLLASSAEPVCDWQCICVEKTQKNIVTM